MDVPIFNMPQCVTIATVVPVTAAWKGTASSRTVIYHQFSIFPILLAVYLMSEFHFKTWKGSKLEGRLILGRGQALH